MDIENTTTELRSADELRVMLWNLEVMCVSESVCIGRVGESEKEKMRECVREKGRDDEEESEISDRMVQQLS